MKKFILCLMLVSLIIPFPTNMLAVEKKDRIDVIYFHATMRCQGCLTIEEYTTNSVKGLFDKQLKDGTITLSSIDFLQEENAHYQEDYKFESQTLILSKKVDGKEVKWKNLDKIWDYSSDFQKFQDYIKLEINKFLKES